MMTKIYVSRKDGKWARCPDIWRNREDSLWEVLSRELPEVWNALPPSAEVSDIAPADCLEFGTVEALTEWIEETNCEGFLAVADIDGTDYAEKFQTKEEAVEYAESLWEEFKCVEGAVVAVIKLPLGYVGYNETVWSKGVDLHD